MLDRERPLHRTTGQLVAEGDGVRTDLQHAVPFGLGQGRQLTEQPAGQRQLHPRRHHGQQVERGLRRRGESPDPGEHRVDDGRRHSGPRCGERLGHEERISAGVPEQSCRGHRGPSGQAGHGRPRQPLEPQAPHPGAAQRAQHVPQGVSGRDLVVAVGHDEQRRQVVDPPADVAQHVERRVVCPVHVLDDEHRRTGPGQLGEHRGEDGVAIAPTQRGGQLAGTGPGGVPKRAQRAGGDEVVTGAVQDSCLLPHRAQERPDHAGLADPRLAGQQHDRTGSAAGPVEGLGDHRELGVTLEERGVHAVIVPRRTVLAPGCAPCSSRSVDR